MLISIFATICLAGRVLTAPIELEKAAESNYDIISRRVAQVGSAMAVLESHLRQGAPTAFDRNQQQQMQINFFRRAIDLNEQITYSMQEGTSEMERRIPRDWKMSITEAVTFLGPTLSIGSSLSTIVGEWSSVRMAAVQIGATRSIGDSLAITQRTTSDFINHVMDHQNALTTATGFDKATKNSLETQLSKVVREYQGGW